MMEAAVATAVGVLVAAGVYLCLRTRTFEVVLGLTLIGYAVNLFLFTSGRLTLDSAPLTMVGIDGHPDPLPQALVLTAIVIGFAMIAFFIVLALRSRFEFGNDALDPAHDTEGERFGYQAEETPALEGSAEVAVAEAGLASTVEADAGAPR